MACISLAYAHETSYRFVIVTSDELLAIRFYVDAMNVCVKQLRICFDKTRGTESVVRFESTVET